MSRGAARAAAALAAAVVLSGCFVPYDFDDVRGADLTYVDPTGVWRRIDDGTPIWEGPAGGFAVAGDYDGDGRWEPAAYVAATGMWHTAGGRGTFHFPAPADPDPSNRLTTAIPVPADYDGDGDTDPAFYVEDTAEWVVEGQATVAFGRRTDDPSIPVLDEGDQWEVPFVDLPIPADYDGDGDDDPAVYRVETGEVHIRGDAAPVRTGMPYGRPAPADYTEAPGDEVAVLGFADDGWFIEGAGALSFEGWSVQTPASADLDADGRAEPVAVDEGYRSTLVHIAGRPHPLELPSVWLVDSFVSTPPALRKRWFDQTYLAEECRLSAPIECPEQDLLAFDSDGFFLRWDDGKWEVLSWIEHPAGATPVAGDYDGDGKPEPAAFDPVTGSWSTEGARGTIAYPAPTEVDADPTTGAIPVPADYDGDGDWEPAFFRESDATWHVEGRPVRQHGRPAAAAPTFAGRPVHDLPTPADLDGDGDVELVTYRLDTRTFHVAGTPAPVDPGWPAGLPVVADHDGDGTDDLGLWDVTGTGTWYRSGLPPTAPFGPIVGLPVPGRWTMVGGDQLAVADVSPVRAWRVPFELEGEGWASGWETLAAASGRPEVRASLAFVEAYVAHCVTGTPAPGECT